MSCDIKKTVFAAEDVFFSHTRKFFFLLLLEQLQLANKNNWKNLEEMFYKFQLVKNFKFLITSLFRPLKLTVCTIYDEKRFLY